MIYFCELFNLAFKKRWMADLPVSIPEDKLALKSCLVTVLKDANNQGFNENDIDEEESLVYYGMRSLQIMNLSTYWRNAGLSVSFIDLVSVPTLSAWWQLIETRRWCFSFVGHPSILPLGCPALLFLMLTWIVYLLKISENSAHSNLMLRWPSSTALLKPKKILIHVKCRVY